MDLDKYGLYLTVYKVLSIMKHIRSMQFFLETEEQILFYFNLANSLFFLSAKRNTDLSSVMGADLPGCC